MKKCTLYVSDLDGTLLNRDESINEKSLEIINGLIEKGMHFTYATARSLVSASKVTKGLNVNYPVIVYNGAFIMETNTGKIIYSCYFNEEEQLYVKNMLSMFEQSPLVYTFVDGEEKVFYDGKHINEGIQRYLDNRKNDRRMQVVTQYDDLYQGKNFYYTCIGEREVLEGLYNHFKDDERFNCTFQQEIYREEYWFEIMPKNATKANAIQYLKQIYKDEKIVCFGDAINDISMFKVADESYATQNAVLPLKEVASGIIGSNHDDGVALWLQQNHK